MLRLYFLALLTSALVAQAPPATEQATGEKPAREPGLYATINTSMGAIVVKLFEKEAPITVKNFTDLVRGRKPFLDPKTGQKVTRPFFTGITFHRVIPGFMIQAGDPTATGAYNAGYTIADEFVPTLKFDVPGRLAMANTGEPHTGSTQFFITDAPTPHLNGKHTIFGQVVEGQEVVAKIARVARDSNNKPRTPVRITSIVLKREGPAPEASAGSKKIGSGTKKAATPEKR